MDIFQQAKSALGRWWRTWRIVIGLFAIAGLFIVAAPYLPDRYDPSTPIDLRAEPTFITPLKLARIARSYPACVNAVKAAGLEVEDHSIESNEPGCGMDRGLVLKQSTYPYGGAVRLTCPMMANLARWEFHVLAPLAREYLGTDVARVEHFGTYSCRNVNGSAEGRRSAHATAQAIDVSGFRLADGRDVSVLRDWDADDDKAAFLRAVRDKSCDIFRTVLSPDYNAKHADHFHFETGRWGICR